MHAHFTCQLVEAFCQRYPASDWSTRLAARGELHCMHALLHMGPTPARQKFQPCKQSPTAAAWLCSRQQLLDSSHYCIMLAYTRG